MSLCAEADFAAVWSFLTVAGEACALDPRAYTIPELAERLEDEDPERLQELFCKLLRRAVRSFRPNNWERYLIKFCHDRGERRDGWELERFGYRKASSRVRLRVLKNLLEYQFVCNNKLKTAINKMENRSLRLSPMGRDSKGRCYWMQTDHRANMRLYREDQDEETWRLIASDRAGLLEAITALKSGKSPVDPSSAEPILNEDSNSVGSPYMPIQANGEENSKTDKSDPEENAGAATPQKIQPAEQEDTKMEADNSSQESEDEEKEETPRKSKRKSPRKGRKAANKSKKSSPVKNSDSRTKSKVEDAFLDERTIASGRSKRNKSSNIVSDEIEENVMLVKGDGEGADCESTPIHQFSEEIEEDVFYVYGEGNGEDCTTGNPAIETSAKDSEQRSEPAEDGEEQTATTSREEDLTDSSISNKDPIPPEEDPTDENNTNDPNETPDTEGSENKVAPLPFSKRFLQKIPKSGSAEIIDGGCAKSKVWSVDSFCTSSQSTESPCITDENTLNETVLLNKTSMLVNDNDSDNISSSANEDKSAINEIKGEGSSDSVDNHKKIFNTYTDSIGSEKVNSLTDTVILKNVESDEIGDSVCDSIDENSESVEESNKLVDRHLVLHNESNKSGGPLDENNESTEKLSKLDNCQSLDEKIELTEGSNEQNDSYPIVKDESKPSNSSNRKSEMTEKLDEVVDCHSVFKEDNKSGDSMDDNESSNKSCALDDNYPVKDVLNESDNFLGENVSVEKPRLPEESLSVCKEESNESEVSVDGNVSVEKPCLPEESHSVGKEESNESEVSVDGNVSVEKPCLPVESHSVGKEESNESEVSVEGNVSVEKSSLPEESHSVCKEESSKSEVSVDDNKSAEKSSIPEDSNSVKDEFSKSGDTLSDHESPEISSMPDTHSDAVDELNKSSDILVDSESVEKPSIPEKRNSVAKEESNRSDDYVGLNESSEKSSIPEDSNLVMKVELSKSTDFSSDSKSVEKDNIPEDNSSVAEDESNRLGVSLGESESIEKQNIPADSLSVVENVSSKSDYNLDDCKSVEKSCNPEDNQSVAEDELNRLDNSFDKSELVENPNMPEDSRSVAKNESNKSDDNLGEIKSIKKPSILEDSQPVIKDESNVLSNFPPKVLSLNSEVDAVPDSSNSALKESSLITEIETDVKDEFHNEDRIVNSGEISEISSIGAITHNVDHKLPLDINVIKETFKENYPDRIEHSMTEQSDRLEDHPSDSNISSNANENTNPPEKESMIISTEEPFQNKSDSSSNNDSEEKSQSHSNVDEKFVDNILHSPTKKESGIAQVDETLLSSTEEIKNSSLKDNLTETVDDSQNIKSQAEGHENMDESFDASEKLTTGLENLDDCTDAKLSVSEEKIPILKEAECLIDDPKSKNSTNEVQDLGVTVDSDSKSKICVNDDLQLVEKCNAKPVEVTAEVKNTEEDGTICIEEYSKGATDTKIDCKSEENSKDNLNSTVEYNVIDDQNILHTEILSSEEQSINSKQTDDSSHLKEKLSCEIENSPSCSETESKSLLEKASEIAEVVSSSIPEKINELDEETNFYSQTNEKVSHEIEEKEVNPKDLASETHFPKINKDSFEEMPLKSLTEDDKVSSPSKEICVEINTDKLPTDVHINESISKEDLIVCNDNVNISNTAMICSVVEKDIPDMHQSATIKEKDESSIKTDNITFAGNTENISIKRSENTVSKEISFSSNEDSENILNNESQTNSIKKGKHKVDLTTESTHDDLDNVKIKKMKLPSESDKSEINLKVLDDEDVSKDGSIDHSDVSKLAKPKLEKDDSEVLNKKSKSGDISGDLKETNIGDKAEQLASKPDIKDENINPEIEENDINPDATSTSKFDSLPEGQIPESTSDIIDNDSKQLKSNVEIKENRPQGMRTRRSESQKDTKVPDSTNIADSKIESVLPKTNKRTRLVKKLNDENKEEIKKIVNEDDKENTKAQESRKRGRDQSDSQSELEEETVVQSKKFKPKQKVFNPKLRKKVEEKKTTQDLSSEDESAIPPKARKLSTDAETTTKKDPVVKKRGRGKGNTVKPKEEENTTLETDDPPVRQSRRIALLKIKEEAQRRQLEEMALRELKAQHKKKNSKNKDQDWEKESSEHDSDEAYAAKKEKKSKKDEKAWKKKAIGWHSSSGGNETDSEPGEEPEDDFDEQHEEDILVQKSDHEFSPESDIDCDEWTPVRRARTLKKEDGEKEEIDIGCAKCGKTDHPEWILLCDSCDAGWHASCLKPVLFLIPEGEWFCPPCNHKTLIESLETALEDHDKHVDIVKHEDMKKKKIPSNQSLDKIENSDEEEEDSEEFDSEKISSESCSSDSSSDDEKIYRLRERRQLPVSYRFKEYDQLISSAIKEEYKEVDNSGAGNQGRGKDISTIIEADKEEKEKQAKLEAEQAGENDGENKSNKKNPPKARRKPRKLTGLEVVSDDCDDNSADEDFKEAGWSSSTSEAISSGQSESTGQSSSSDSSAPLKRATRSSRAKGDNKSKSKKGNSRSDRKKKRRRIIDESTSDSTLEKESSAKKKRASGGDSAPKNKKRKKEKNEEESGNPDAKKEKGKAKIKYGGLSDSSKSSHDWSPAHRTRQRKYNYMEEPNTESEDEVNKPSGKHMDSSDEYKGESSSDSDSSRGKKKPNARYFDDDIKNLNTSKESYQKQLQSHGTDLLKGSLVPIVKLSDISPVKGDGAIKTDGSPQSVTPNVNKAKRGGKTANTRIVGAKIGDSTDSKDANVVPENADGETPITVAPVKTTPMTPLQIERNRKRTEKLMEKEKRKEERLKKKEEKQQIKDQKAKEREEKKQAKLAAEQSKIERKARSDYMSGQHSFNLSTPIPIRQATNVPIQPMQPQPNFSNPLQMMSNIRGPMPQFPNPHRMRMDHPNLPLQHSNKEGIPIENRDQLYNYQRPPPTQITSQSIPAKNEMSEGEERRASEERKAMPPGMDYRPPMYPEDIRKSFPIGHQPPYPGLRGVPPSFENRHPIARPPFHPAYVGNMDNPILRENLHGRQIVNSLNESSSVGGIPRNGIPVVEMNPQRKSIPPPLRADLESRSPHLAIQDPGTPPKRRGRGLGKKTLARQAAAAGGSTATSEGSTPSPSNSPLMEGTLTVAGAPQPFRPNIDPPSVITRMPHMMPPPYRGSTMYNSSQMFGSPNPLANHFSNYRHPRPPIMLDASPSGGGPIPMTSAERSSPHNPYSPYQSPYYPPSSTPPQLGPYPPPHGRYPPGHIPGPPSNSPRPPNPADSAETEEKNKPPREQPTATQFIKSEIKQEPVNIKQSSSPTEELEESNSNERRSVEPDEQPSNFSVGSGPPPRSLHPQLKHTESKGARSRISMTTAARYPQGPYAPQYGPYAPQPPPAPEVSYLHPPHHPGHPAQHLSSVHRPMYSHHASHVSSAPMPVRPLEQLPAREDGPPNPVPQNAAHPPGPGPHGEETSVFGGLVSYFSSQREDDMDT